MKSRMSDFSSYFEEKKKYFLSHPKAFILPAVSAYIALNGLYLLGVIFALPRQAVSFLNYSSILHLFWQVAFGVVVWSGMARMFHFLVNHFDEVNSRTINIILDMVPKNKFSSSFGARLRKYIYSYPDISDNFGAVLCYAVSAILSLFLFLDFSSLSSSADWIIAAQVAILLSASSFMLGVASSSLIFRGESRIFDVSLLIKSSVISAIPLVFVVGILRVEAMKSTDGITLAGEKSEKYVAFIMPASGGDLMYDKSSGNYFILSQGKISIWIKNDI